MGKMLEVDEELLQEAFRLGKLPSEREIIEAALREYIINHKELVKKPKVDLTTLLSQMPEDYQAVEEDFGEPVGKEEW